MNQEQITKVVSALEKRASAFEKTAMSAPGTIAEDTGAVVGAGIGAGAGLVGGGVLGTKLSKGLRGGPRAAAIVASILAGTYYGGKKGGSMLANEIGSIKDASMDRSIAAAHRDAKLKSALAEEHMKGAQHSAKIRSLNKINPLMIMPGSDK